MLDSAKKVIDLLNNNGFEGYFVGGFVRDYLLGIKYNDIDIATNAKMEDMIKIGGIPSGLKYGTALFKMDNYFFEVTTYRIESSYIDNRHPSNIKFVNDIHEDLKRRDFTINAMAMDKNLKIIDDYNGINDLNNKIIKSVLNPFDRFNEDALRILRAFYFVSKLGFDIDNETLNGINDNAHLIKNVSGIRIINELEKLFNSKYMKKAINLIVDSKVIDNLYGMKEALLLISNKDDIDIDTFLAICNINYDIKKYYQLSNKKSKLYNDIKRVLNEGINKYCQYKYGIEAINIAIKIKKLNDEETNYKIEKLPINNLKDLKISGNDLKKISNDNNYYSKVLEELQKEVVLGNIKNDYDELYNYACYLFDKK